MQETRRGAELATLGDSWRRGIRDRHGRFVTANSKRTPALSRILSRIHPGPENRDWAIRCAVVPRDWNLDRGQVPIFLGEKMGNSSYFAQPSILLLILCFSIF